MAGCPRDEVVEKIAAALTRETKLIALSQVIWSSGQTLPGKELAQLGPPLLLDGAQSVGAIAIDVRELGCDFLVFPGQKWLTGPDATGGLYVRRDWIPRAASQSSM